jgi:hypothetical protein
MAPSEQNTGLLILLGMIAAVVVTTLSACTKQATTAGGSGDTAADSSSATSTNASSAAQPVALPPPPAYIATAAENVPRQEVAGPPDPFLTQQLQIYVRQFGRMPRSFAEFAGARLDSVPRPPPGMKWVIDAARMEVKAVPSQ